MWVGLWHWLTALLFLILIATGLVMHFGPRDFIPDTYRWATNLHDFAGIGLALVYSLFLPAIVATGYWRNYVPRWRGLRSRVLEQIRTYIVAAARGQQADLPIDDDTRFNPLQQLVYFVVIFGLLPFLIGTGLLYLSPEAAPDEVAGLAGLWPLALTHTALAWLGCVYALLHIYLATLHGSPHPPQGQGHDLADN